MHHSGRYLSACRADRCRRRPLAERVEHRGGYLVLRREAGDATLRQLTPTPLAEARYRDTSVEPGKRYIYSVVAVDTQVPLPNISAESEPVEETAR